MELEINATTHSYNLAPANFLMVLLNIVSHDLNSLFILLIFKERAREEDWEEGKGRLCVCVYAHVCVKERERERERVKELTSSQG